MIRLLTCRGFLFILALMTPTASSPAGAPPNSPLLEQILQKLNAPLKDQITLPEHEVQILYTQIDRASYLMTDDPRDSKNTPGTSTPDGISTPRVR